MLKTSKEALQDKTDRSVGGAEKVNGHSMIRVSSDLCLSICQDDKGDATLARFITNRFICIANKYVQR